VSEGKKKSFFFYNRGNHPTKGGRRTAAPTGKPSPINPEKRGKRRNIFRKKRHKIFLGGEAEKTLLSSLEEEEKTLPLIILKESSVVVLRGEKGEQSSERIPKKKERKEKKALSTHS